MTTPEPEIDGWPDVNESLVSPEDRAKAVFEAKVADIGRARSGAAEAATAEVKAANDAQRAVDKAGVDRDIALQAADFTADQANFSKFFDAIATLATGSVDRARSSADTIQKAAAAIAALYTGVLGLVFSITENPLPGRGTLAPLFLGAAVVLSSGFLAYLGPSSQQIAVPSPANPRPCAPTTGYRR